MNKLDSKNPDEFKERDRMSEEDMMDLYEERYDCFNEHPYALEFLKKHIFTSMTDWHGNPLYTQKPDIDIRLYGFNPEIPEEKEKGEITLKWITGKYYLGGRDLKWVSPDNFTPDHSDPVYRYIPINHTQWYRSKKKPQYASPPYYNNNSSDYRRNVLYRHY
jgi:hypothetical protein